MYRAYHIEEGETISSLVKNTNMEFEDLKRLNGEFDMTPGNMIMIPMSNSDLFDTYIVKQGDSVYKIATSYNIPYKQLLLLNGLDENDYIYPNQQMIVPKKDTLFYITNTGDTIKSISKNLGTNSYDILEQNENLIVLPDQIIVYKKRF